MDNLYSPSGFYWWFGVVENRLDPLMLGRCQVRIFGYHTKNKSILPTADLPWAYVITPITSAAMSGIGDAPLGLVEGTTVFGFFRDGDDNQEPLIIGSAGGIPQSAFIKSLNPTDGFQDPSHTYPLSALMDEPDTNRLARGITDSTIVPLKNSKRSTGVTTALGGPSWDEPISSYNATYPKNHVFASESGHTREIDDTPGFERTHEYHAAGTFTEIDKNGTMVRRIVGDSYEVMERNGFIYIKGKANVTVEGDVNIYVKNNCNLQVDGNLKTQVHGDYKLNVAGDMDVSVGGDFQLKAAKDIAIEALNIDWKALLNLRGAATGTFAFKGLAFYLESTTIAAIKAATLGLAAPIMPQSIFTLNPALATAEVLALVPLIGEYNTPSVDSPVGSKSPTEPNLPQLGFTLSAAQVKSFTAAKIQAFTASTDPNGTIAGKRTASEYVALKTDELASNAVVSAPVNVDPNATTNTPDQYKCAVGSLVVQAALKYVGVTETGTGLGTPSNYGGKIGGEELPIGVPGVIDMFLTNVGLDNTTQVKRTGLGYYWCASFVAQCWKEAGLATPSGAGSCVALESWAHANGLFSAIPKLGAIILYGTPGAAHHCGIVTAVGADGTITSCEGNTTGGGFSSDGCGVFAKTPRSYIGFILPPPCAS